MTNPRTPRVSLVLVLVLLVALGVGAAASILVGASTAAPPPSSGPTPELNLPLWVVLAGCLVILGLIIGGFVLQHRVGESTGMPNRGVVVVLTVILLGALFVVASRAVGVGGQAQGGSSLVPVNQSNPVTNVTNGSHAPDLTGPGGYLRLFPNLPYWVPFVALALVVTVLAVFALPQTRRYLADRRDAAARRDRPVAPVPPGVREALTRASAELDLGGDPRIVILSLYHEMLLHLRPMVGSIETSTPEEIRVNHLTRLGVRAEAARTLTRLFEEARYSTHPMGVGDGARAQEAVQATLEDLDRRAPRA